MPRENEYKVFASVLRKCNSYLLIMKMVNTSISMNFKLLQTTAIRIIETCKRLTIISCNAIWKIFKIPKVSKSCIMIRGCRLLQRLLQSISLLCRPCLGHLTRLLYNTAHNAIDWTVMRVKRRVEKRVRTKNINVVVETI